MYTSLLPSYTSFHLSSFFFFFFNDTATTEIYTLSLHDALPIFDPELARETYLDAWGAALFAGRIAAAGSLLEVSRAARSAPRPDRKSTRLNSSHQIISYAVFCLKKKKKKKKNKRKKQKTSSTIA